MAARISHFNGKTSFLIINTNPISRSHTPKAVAVAVSAAKSQSYWASIDAEIETYLKTAIPIRPPESVFEPMHHLTFAAPRTTASSLCVAACELVGGDRSQAMAAAAAIHLMHAAAYTHEHLPLTDRPPPASSNSVPHKYSPNIELLTGDGIAPFAFELMARSMGLGRSCPSRILRVIVEITRAGGSEGVIDGQYRQNSGSVDFEYVCEKKEGGMHACGAACGAILGGGAEDEIGKLRKFGLYAGMVQGMLAGKNPGLEGKIGRLKELALRELEGFEGNGARLELISGLVEPSRADALHSVRS